MLSNGSIFAGYRIERILGTGGMGTVYLARNPELPRSEALKVLRPELSRDAGFRARFTREADVAASLDHPNIVSVHRRGEFNGQLWIAMQFVDGTDADNALRAGSMTPARAVHIVEQVGKALDYAHQRGVIHRDVKPANFLLSGPVGAEERVLLGDFGIARALGRNALTAAGSVVATLSYAAPEVLNGAPIDGRADIYSLGCALFRMLTGRAPFAKTDGIGSVIEAHLHAPPPRVTDQLPGLSPRMDAVIATALAKTPSQRFASARQLGEAAIVALNANTSFITVPWQGGPPATGTPPISQPPAVPGEQFGAPVGVSGQAGSVPRPDSAGNAPLWQQSGPVPMTVGTNQPPIYPVEPAHRRIPFPPPPRKRRRWRWAGFTLSAAAVAALVAALIVLNTHQTNRARPPQESGSPATSTSPATPSTVAVTALPGLLLPADQVAGIIGASSAMMVVPVRSSLYDDSAEIVEHKECLTAFGPAEHVTYGDSGWTGAQLEYMRDNNFEHEAFQGVIAFPTVAAAQKEVADQMTLWSKCQQQTITLNKPNAVQHRILGPVVDANGTLSMSSTLKESAGLGCQHAVAARENIVIDTNVCRQDVTSQAVDLLNAIIARIPH